MSKFVTNDWRIFFRSNNDMQCTFVGVALGDEVIDMPGTVNEENVYRAKLIAGAPELLRAAHLALEELRRVSPSFASPDLRDAIAKIED